MHEDLLSKEELAELLSTDTTEKSGGESRPDALDDKQPERMRTADEPAYTDLQQTVSELQQEMRLLRQRVEVLENGGSAGVEVAAAAELTAVQSGLEPSRLERLVPEVPTSLSRIERFGSRRGKRL